MGRGLKGAIQERKRNIRTGPVLLMKLQEPSALSTRFVKTKTASTIILGSEVVVRADLQFSPSIICKLNPQSTKSAVTKSAVFHLNPLPYPPNRSPLSFLLAATDGDAAAAGRSGESVDSWEEDAAQKLADTPPHGLTLSTLRARRPAFPSPFREHRRRPPWL